MILTIRRLAAPLLLTALFSAAPSYAANAAAGAGAATAAGTAALPGNSVYQLPVTLTDQDGKTFDLVTRRGKPMIVSMFYTSCQFVCPMLIETMQLTSQKLTDEERGKLGMLLVTFDPAHDSIKALTETATKHHLNAAQWTLARTDAPKVRKLAATLGIQYRQLPDGDFNHSTVLILLDGDGRIVGRSNKMGSADPAFVALIKNTLLKSK